MMGSRARTGVMESLMNDKWDRITEHPVRLILRDRERSILQTNDDYEYTEHGLSRTMLIGATSGTLKADLILCP